MAQNDGAPGGAGGDEKSNKNRVAEYLQAPRKKRKSYVLVACGKNISQDLQAGIDQFLKVQFKQLAISHPKTPDELKKQFARQVVLLVIDDEFGVDLAQCMELVRDLKKKRTASATPVLFLTRSPEDLIKTYNTTLLPFQEVDDYLNYSKAVPGHVFSKIRASLMNQNRRKSRRYKVDIPVSYFLLHEDRFLEGAVIDLSIHGALLKSGDGRIFHPGEQLKIHVPIATYLPPTEGDYLKLSAKVRRVFISGTQAGVSFEFVTDKQLMILTRYLTELVNSQNVRRMQAFKTRNVSR